MSTERHEDGRILERVIRDLSRYNMLPVGGPREAIKLGVAVSGGADSVFLLEILRELAPRLELQLSVIHVNHRTRGESSDADAAFVERMARNLGLPFHLRVADVPRAAEDCGENLEQAGRLARYSFFADLRTTGAVDRIATGHNRDDQAETVLYRILRGSGWTGLAGILPVTREGIIRPLLAIGREEIRSYLRARGIPWREDATNQDETPARNRLRLSVMPQLRSGFNPRLDDALCSLAELARDEEEYWSRVVSPPKPRNGIVVLSIGDLIEPPVAVVRRSLRAAIAVVKGDLRQIELPHVERIVEMAKSDQGSGRLQIPGLDVFRSFDWIRLAPAGYDSHRERDFEVPVNVPGNARLPHGSVISLLIEAQGSENDYATVKMGLDWPKVLAFRELERGEWKLRNWRPGDCYRPAGRNESQKLKLLFQEHRIPLWDRRRWPVFLCNQTILWARRFGPASEFAASPESASVLRLEELLPEHESLAGGFTS